jgi:hypothetical protein
MKLLRADCTSPPPALAKYFIHHVILSEIKFAADAASFICSCVSGTSPSFICLPTLCGRASGIHCPLIGEYCDAASFTRTVLGKTHAYNHKGGFGSALSLALS